MLSLRSCQWLRKIQADQPPENPARFRPSCELPITQAKLAEATGLTLVHLNRMVQELRAANLVVIKSKTLTIPNLEALMSAALFNPNYLHLDQAEPSVNVNSGEAAQLRALDDLSRSPGA
jgi:hypothetical protein